jgi:heme/copper-type cytochrome/quinol oxidase subunit 4
MSGFQPRRIEAQAERVAIVIVFLVIAGSVWIIANLNSNMVAMPMQ